jgi:hypothetical protein
MGSKYTTQSASGYNSSPPADDGTQTASNLITWSGVKSKLTDPVKNLADAINTALVTAFDYSVRQISSSDNTVATDHMKCVEIAPTVTTAVTVSLGDAATMTNNYRVFIKNSSSRNQTVGLVTAADTIDGTAAGTITLLPKAGVLVQTNSTPNGYLIVSRYSLNPTRSAIAGLTLSTAGSSGTMSIAAGEATDSTNAVSIALASALSKTTSAWAVGTGNGGLDTGAIATATWYHFYLIMRPDTGVVDVLFSTSASAPTMPTNYTYKRRIGSGLTNGSSQWVAFTQDGDYFRWSASVRDINANNPGTSAVTATLASIPTGVNVHALINVIAEDVTNAIGRVYVSDLSATDEAPSAGSAPLGTLNSTTTSTGAWGGYVRTNTSAQIRYRIETSAATTNIRIASLGWLDRRGRDS